MKEKVRPIYSELQGYLSQAPKSVSGEEKIYDDTSIMKQLNASIEELETVSGRDYSRYKEVGKSMPWNGKERKYFDLLSYRSNLGGLILRLHGEYFPDENSLFSGMFSAIPIPSQDQDQTNPIQALLEVQSKIDSKMSEYGEGTKERLFLKKVKVSLVGVRDINSLIILILKTGKDLSLTMSQILKIFS
jgi:hypothetical protein